MITWRYASVCPDAIERSIWRSIFTPVTENHVIRKPVVMFACISQFGIPQVCGTRVFLPADSKHHIVFAGIHIVLPQLVDVIHILEAEGMHRIFQAEILPRVKRILYKRIILHLLVPRAIGSVSLEKPVFVEDRGGSSAHTEARPFDGIPVDGAVHRSKIKLVLLRILVGRNIARHQYGNRFFHEVEHRNRTELSHQLFYGVRVFLLQVVRPAGFPEIVSLLVSVVSHNHGSVF